MFTICMPETERDKTGSCLHFLHVLVLKQWLADIQEVVGSIPGTDTHFYVALKNQILVYSFRSAKKLRFHLLVTYTGTFF